MKIIHPVTEQIRKITIASLGWHRQYPVLMYYLKCPASKKKTKQSYVKKQERMTYTLGKKQAVETACENNQRVDLTDRLQHIYYKYIQKGLPWWSSG